MDELNDVAMKKFTKNGLNLVFFKKENDKKFSFYIENEDELTEQLLATVKTKRVREDKIKYAVNGIFDLLSKKDTGYYWSIVAPDNELRLKLIKNHCFEHINGATYEAICRGHYKFNLLTTTKILKMEKNPIIELAELTQRQFGANIETRVTGKTGADHMPTVYVEIELPDGRIFKASGTNKRIAKQKAAEKALLNFHKF